MGKERTEAASIQKQEDVYIYEAGEGKLETLKQNREQKNKRVVELERMWHFAPAREQHSDSNLVTLWRVAFEATKYTQEMLSKEGEKQEEKKTQRKHLSTETRETFKTFNLG